MDTSSLGLNVPRFLTQGKMLCCGSLYIFLSIKQGSFSHNLWVKKNVIRGHFIAASFRSIVFGFTLDLWAIESLILGHSSSVGYRFYLKI